MWGSISQVNPEEVVLEGSDCTEKVYNLVLLYAAILLHKTRLTRNTRPRVLQGVTAIGSVVGINPVS